MHKTSLKQKFKFEKRSICAFVCEKETT